MYQSGYDWSILSDLIADHHGVVQSCVAQLALSVDVSSQLDKQLQRFEMHILGCVKKSCVAKVVGDIKVALAIAIPILLDVAGIVLLRCVDGVLQQDRHL